MKQDFVITKNVTRFLAGMEVVAEPVKGVVGMGLAFGEPGTGKTEAADWYRVEHEYPFVRAYDGMSRRALMSAIVAETGQERQPHRKRLDQPQERPGTPQPGDGAKREDKRIEPDDDGRDKQNETSRWHRRSAASFRQD